MTVSLADAKEYEGISPWPLSRVPPNRFSGGVPTPVIYGRNFFFDADYALGLLSRFETAEEFLEEGNAKDGWEFYEAWETEAKNREYNPHEHVERLENNPNAALIKRRRDDQAIYNMWVYFIEWRLAKDPNCEGKDLKTLLRQIKMSCSDLPDWTFPKAKK